MSRVIIYENGDTSVYPDTDSAEIDLEPIDVANGEYQAFDENVNKLEMTVATEYRASLFGIFKSTFERVKIRKIQNPINDEIVLRRILLETLYGANTRPPESMPLKELVDRVADIT